MCFKTFWQRSKKLKAIIRLEFAVFLATSFEAVQYFEDIDLQPKQDDHKDNPDMKYQLFKYVLAIDHFKNQLYILSTILSDADDSDFKKLHSFEG